MVDNTGVGYEERRKNFPAFKTNGFISRTTNNKIKNRDDWIVRR